MRIWQYTSLALNSVGGVERHIAEVSAALRRAGHEVHVGLTPPTETPMIVHSHGDVLPPTSFFLGSRRKPSRSTWIHVCHGTTAGRVIACREYASLSGARGAFRDFSLVRLADAALAVSEQALLEARRYFLYRGPAEVIRNGADPAIFKALSRISDAQRLIFVGRSGDRVKNCDRLLLACAGVARRHADFELWMAPGYGNTRGLPSFVRELGPLAGRDLADKLAHCRALVLCSLYEGDPLVLHEAKSMGLPVLASKIPSLKASLRDYPNSVFVNPRDAQCLEEGIERIIAPNAVFKPTPVQRTWDQVAGELTSFYARLS